MNESSGTPIERILTDISKDTEKINGPVRIMEVCGTHTVALRQTGVLSLLPESVELISGPGCPVCVTPATYIENALALIEEENVLIATFGDMVKVPAADGRSLSAYLGSDKIKIIYSPAELLSLACETERDIVFLGVGFETTIPVIASVFKQAAIREIPNLFLYCAFKLVTPALTALLADPDFSVHGFLLPGHVSVVIGLEPYKFISEEYGLPGAVAGFEGEDILLAIRALLRMLAADKPEIENTYTRVVKKTGNQKARDLMEEIFEPADTVWRGFGTIPLSGMALKGEYENFDACRRFGIPELKNTDPRGCLCGEIVQGKSTPPDCRFFGTSCTPDRPTGPCMVSTEGTCAAYFQFGGKGL